MIVLGAVQVKEGPVVEIVLLTILSDKRKEEIHNPILEPGHHHLGAPGFSE
jgi:hypothetical protein